MRKNNQFYIRKAHRYLGVFIGIQLLLWTLGGLYFSWSDMDEVHGDTLIHHDGNIKYDIHFISPDSVFRKMDREEQIGEIRSLNLLKILDSVYYQFVFLNEEQKKKVILANVHTGNIRKPIQKDEAIEMARRAFIPDAEIKSITLLSEGDISGHHEYRGRPLPAWEISFDHASKSKIFIAADYGQLISLRNKQWRRFDFLWMLHTMDYEGRDNITNWILRVFSVLGLVTVFSGFTLFYVSSPLFKRKRK